MKISGQGLMTNEYGIPRNRDAQMVVAVSGLKVLAVNGT
jgi:hypothetical protein